jgi:hypothetical protein
MISDFVFFVSFLMVSFPYFLLYDSAEQPHASTLSLKAMSHSDWVKFKMDNHGHSMTVSIKRT